MLSVITPVYNGDRFIESCIDGVIDQNCKEIEHIIVDGGSSDRTVTIIQKYAAQYPHIRWISKKDQGQSDAMNKGIALARGEILAILNVDDYYEPNALNRIIERFETLTEPSLLVGNCNVWSDSHSLVQVNRPRKLNITDLLLGAEINPHPVNPTAYFYHKSLHQQIGLYKVDEHYVMDLDFLLRAVQTAHVKYVDETWGNYRCIEGTKTVSDIANGHSRQRAQQLLQIHTQKLSSFQQWQIKLKYQLHHNKGWQRILYFSRHPQDLFPRLKSRLMKAFS